jgi:hypothetical protein
MEYCCTKMKNALNNTRMPIEYSPIAREYYLVFRDGPPFRIHAISHCLWCGEQLPKNLRETFFEVLEKECNRDRKTIGDIMSDEDIPLEFKSDAWWKKRGL